MADLIRLENSALTSSGTGEESFSLAPAPFFEGVTPERPLWYDIRFRNQETQRGVVVRIDARTMARLGMTLIQRVIEDGS